MSKFFSSFFGFFHRLIENAGFSDLSSFFGFLFYYLRRKIVALSLVFEYHKNNLVKLFSMKRGRYNRPFMHIATMTVLAMGVVASPFLAETYPVFTGQQNHLAISASNSKESIAVSSDVFQTVRSAKPRDSIINYTVERGDTLSTIAEKFGISAETIRWANDIRGDSITVGDVLKILPVSGIAYKVAKGDSVYSIAKKLSSDAQKIVDFPFNDFANAETFSLVEGQILIVPDGVKPEEKATYRPQTYIVQGPISVSGSGFAWPLHGSISQFASWYHMAIDIATSYGAPIVAAQDGTVTYVSVGAYDSGYGSNVWIDNGAGFATHYAHMTGSNVSAGDTVVAGKTVVGWVGMTGRTTGPHLHFELRRNGVLVNPLSYLK